MNGTGLLLVLLFITLTSSNPVPINESPQDFDTAAAAELLGNYYNDAAHQADVNEGPAVSPRVAYLYELLKAAQEEELAREVDESAAASGVSGYPIAVGGNEEGDAGLAAVDARQPPTGHSVEKRRRRRYGFWVTAINKMDNGHLKGFLGKHRNIYNVYKRNMAHPLAFPRMH